MKRKELPVDTMGFGLTSIFKHEHYHYILLAQTRALLFECSQLRDICNRAIALARLRNYFAEKTFAVQQNDSANRFWT
jgi:hypothetical protein